MKILDRYIIKEFIISFLFAILLFTTVAIVIDLTEKINDIIQKGVPWMLMITQFYTNFIPWIDALLTPLFVFITVIFFTSRLAGRSEIIAILASGVSYYRLMRPYMMGAAILSLGLFTLNHFIVPNANKKRLAFEFAYLESKFDAGSNNLHMQVEKDKFIFMRNYHVSDSLGNNFGYEVFRDDKLIYKLHADRIQWKSKLQKWEVTNYMSRTFDREGEHLKKGLILDTVFPFRPTDFESRLSLKEEMNSIELLKYIKLLKTRGEDHVVFFEIEFYRRTADAVAIFILTAIGLAIASRKVRGGMGVHLVWGFLLSGGYIVFMQFSTTFSTNGNLPPILGVWIPNITFGILAAILLWRTPK